MVTGGRQRWLVSAVGFAGFTDREKFVSALECWNYVIRAAVDRQDGVVLIG